MPACFELCELALLYCLQLLCSSVSAAVISMCVSSLYYLAVQYSAPSISLTAAAAKATATHSAHATSTTAISRSTEGLLLLLHTHVLLTVSVLSVASSILSQPVV
jgi:hypothetical protein